MKKSLIIFSSLCLLSLSSIAQDAPEKKQADFDKKFRFGIRATPQLCWLTSKGDIAKSAGVGTGFGFGLMLDFRLSDIIRFSTGIGGDFDGGKINYKYNLDNNNPSNNFSVNMALDKENNMIKAKDGTNLADYSGVNGNQFFSLDQRKYKATYVTIPLLLKMSTQEYSGMRHVFVFGGELGIRAGLKANDTYHEGFKTVVTGTTTTSEKLTELSMTGLNVGKDGSLLPLRFGMNLGYGIEYRLGGSTALYTSLNYFHSFTNLVKSESDYLSKGQDNTVDPATSTINFSNLSQSHFAKAVRLSIGLMF